MDSFKINGEALVHAVTHADQMTLDTILTPFLPWESNILAGLSFIKSEYDLSQKFLGMQMLASFLRAQGDLVSAVSVAEAILQYLHQAWNAGQTLWPDVHMMIANLLDLLVDTMTEVGQSQQIIQHVEDWITLLKLIDRRDYYEPRLRLKQVEALMNWGPLRRRLPALTEGSKDALNARSLI